jgi:integrase
LKTLVLDSVSSPITKRVYNMALDEFMGWFQQAPRPGFTKATVSAWRVSLEDRRLGSSSIIIRMSAIRKLAAEAADNGLLAPELAAGISRVKSAKTQGIRVGNWLSLRQAQALLSAPDTTIIRGLRDRAILAVLLGCGLRRSEVAALTFSHLQQRDGRWCIVDLVGKHGRVRTAPMPTWVKVAIDAWAMPAGVTEGHVFRSVNRADRVTGESLGEKVVWQLIKPYAVAAGVPGIAPHDLRRTCAKLCRAGGGELEQIQLLLGHASVQTTERYPGHETRSGSCSQRCDQAENGILIVVHDLWSYVFCLAARERALSKPTKRSTSFCCLGKIPWPTCARAPRIVS